MSHRILFLCRNMLFLNNEKAFRHRGSGFVVKHQYLCRENKIKMQGLVGQVFDEYIYVNFDKNFIEVIQGAGGNKVNFKVNSYDEYFIESHWRVLKS